MALWRQIARGLRALMHRSAVDAELDDELRDYFERAQTDLIREGLSSDEAARAARSKHGDVDRAREDLREYGWENAVEETLGDLKHAGRRLRSSPAFSLVAVPTLALGIGASTAIFSVVVPILFEPLPYPNADRVVTLADRDRDGAPLDVTYGTYLEVAARSRSFERLAVADRWQPALVGVGESERLIGDRVSADYFRVLGVAPAEGRAFDRSDDVYGGPRVAIVSDGLARRRFGGASAVVGRTIRLDDIEHTVIGVMPANFHNVMEPAAEVWAPRQYRENAPFESAEWGHHLRMIGRLAPGVSVAQAHAELATISGSPIDAFPRPPWATFETGLHVESLKGAVTGSARPVLLAILGAVLLLLIIACANVANLLLARGVARRGELAVRAALGAGRARLARQLLTESLVLAVLGGAAGLGVAVVGVRAIVAVAPTGLPRIDAVGVDAWAFLFALALTTLVGLAVGLAPALRGARADVRVDLHAGARTTGASHHVLRRALVVTEVALALVLLAGAGLLLRSVERLLSTTPGFDASHRLTLQVVATGYADESDQAAMQFFESALAAVRGVPGVVDAAFTTQLPLSGEFDSWGVEFESAPEASPTASPGVLRYVVTPDWFATMGIPLLQGRLLDPQDRPGAPRAVLISASFAKRRFGDADPIGQRLRIGPDIGRAERPWSTVVGVVGDVKQASLALSPPDAFYIALGQWNWVDLVQSLVVRTEGDPAALVPSLKAAIWSVDSDPPITRITTMEDLVAASEAERRFALLIFAVFALAALVLAALGVYGVIAGSVAERSREIGLRSALGATPLGILSLVVRQGMGLAGIGVAIGLAIAAAVTRGLESLLYDVTPLDSATFAGVVVLLVLVGAMASWIPAWRASRVDPTVALRGD